MISGIYVQLQCSCSAVYLKAAKENVTSTKEVCTC